MDFVYHIQLGEFVISQKGIKPIILRKKPFEQSLPYLDISALETNDIKEYTLSELGTRSTKDDVIVVWDGSRSGLTFKGRDGIVGSTLMNLSHVCLEQEYLYLFLKSKFPFLNGNTVGTGIPHVNPELLFNLEIPYTATETQKEIVNSLKAKLQNINLLFSQQHALITDTLLASNIQFDRNEDMNIVIANFRQAVLQAAFSGQLTTNWRKKHKIKPKTRRTGDYENFLGEFDTPETWQWTNIKNISKLSVGTTPSRNVKAYWKGTTPWISSGEVSNNFLFYSNEKITDLAIKETNVKLLSENTILIGMIGEGKTRGKVALLKITSAINQNICGITLTNDSIPEFVWLYFQFRYLEIRGGSNKSRAGSSQTALNSKIIGRFNICLPPVNEQKEIVRLVQYLFEISNRLIVKYDAAKGDLEKLEMSMLTEAFKLSNKESRISKHSYELVIEDIRNKKMIAEREKYLTNKIKLQKRTIMRKQLEINPTQLLEFIKTNFSTRPFSFNELLVKLDNGQNEYEDLKDAIFLLAQERLNQSEPRQCLELVYDKVNHKQLIKLKS